MKNVATLSVRQDPDEPQLKIRLLRRSAQFYIKIESDHPGIQTSMPLRIKTTNLRDAIRG